MVLRLHHASLNPRFLATERGTRISIPPSRPLPPPEGEEEWHARWPPNSPSSCSAAVADIAGTTRHLSHTPHERPWIQAQWGRRDRAVARSQRGLPAGPVAAFGLGMALLPPRCPLCPAGISPTSAVGENGRRSGASEKPWIQARRWGRMTERAAGGIWRVASGSLSAVSLAPGMTEPRPGAGFL